MRRKKLAWLVGVALILVTTLAMPAASVSARPERFSASGQGEITYMPPPVPLGPTTLLFAGEVVEGTVEDSDWPALEGAELYSVHTSIVTIDPASGDIKGAMQGTFTLTASDGSVLEGTMVARQSGNIYGDISSAGSWIATGGTGIFKKVPPSGKWESTFGVNGLGTFSWDGKLNP